MELIPNLTIEINDCTEDKFRLMFDAHESDGYLKADSKLADYRCVAWINGKIITNIDQSSKFYGSADGLVILANKYDYSVILDKNADVLASGRISKTISKLIELEFNSTNSIIKIENNKIKTRNLRLSIEKEIVCSAIDTFYIADIENCIGVSGVAIVNKERKLMPDAYGDMNYSTYYDDEIYFKGLDHREMSAKALRVAMTFQDNKKTEKFLDEQGINDLILIRRGNKEALFNTRRNCKNIVGWCDDICTLDGICNSKKKWKMWCIQNR